MSSWMMFQVRIKRFGSNGVKNGVINVCIMMFSFTQNWANKTHILEMHTKEP